MLKLYEFPISHYCEKVRWALEYKGLAYESVALLPGLHMFKAKRLAPKSCVPILKHRGTIVQNSANIISYLENEFPRIALSPASKTLRKEMVAWENFADREIGPHVRRLVYHFLLDQPATVKPFFAHNGPWFSDLYLKATYKPLTKFMRKAMNIGDEEAARSHEALDKAIDVISNHVSKKQFMVGNSFTRADIAVCALLAPLVLPKGYGLNWPDQKTLPHELQKIMSQYAEPLSFVQACYEEYRSPSAVKETRYEYSH